MKTLNKNVKTKDFLSLAKLSKSVEMYCNTSLTKKAKTAFTLVELIVVITILAILATIAFLSFQNYSSNARDANRQSTLANISKGLELYTLKTRDYPVPENIYGTGNINGELLSYVGEIGVNTSKVLGLNTDVKDPLTNKYYTYGTSYDSKYYQIRTTLENQLASTNIVNSTLAATLQSKVTGNYKGLLKKGSYIYNLPSLIFSNTGTVSLTGNTTYFIADKSTNTVYDVSGNRRTTNTQSPTDILTLVKSSTGVVTYQTIPTDTASWNTNSGSLGTALGYSIDTIGLAIYGDKYITDKANLSVNVVNNVDNTPPAGTYAISGCPTVNTAQNGTSPTKANILANINSYIGCNITGGQIAGYTYSGTIAPENKMVLVVDTADTATTEWGLYGTDLATLNNITATTNTTTMTGNIVSWDGLANTQKIVTRSTRTAAQLCNAKGTGRYLPATEELNQLYCYSNQAATSDPYYTDGDMHANCVGKGYISRNIGTLSSFATSTYWSSTEYGSYASRYQVFNDGNRGSAGKNNTLAVRCVSRF